MFGPYGGAMVFDLPDSRSMAAVSPAVTNSGALPRFEAHELFDSSDLTAIAGRAQGINYRPPGTRPSWWPPVGGHRRGRIRDGGYCDGSAIQVRQHACNSLTMRHVP